jgi:hypothetical protein
MVKSCSLAAGLAMAVSFSLATSVWAQARSTAVEPARLSVFGGVNGTLTGLDDGKNVGVTAGADLGFRPFFTLRPSIEVRGTLPIHKGSIDDQKNVLFGFQLAERYGRLRPYGDVLFGRGAIRYELAAPGANDTFVYFRTVSNVLAFGGGADYDLGASFALKADGQYQRYETPVTASGTLYASSLTAGIVYRIDLNRRVHHLRYR